MPIIMISAEPMAEGHPEPKPNTVLLDPAQLAVDDVEPAEGDTVTLERVEGTVEGNRDGRILVRITSVGGEPLPEPKKPADPLDEEADIRRAALASDGLED